MSTRRRPTKGKGKTKRKKKAVVEEDEFTAMDLAQLQVMARTLTSELADVRRSRSYFQIERDQVMQSYDIVRTEIKQKRAKIKNVEAAMEQKQEDHRRAIGNYLQRVTYLEYEHTNNAFQVNKKGEAAREDEELYHEQKKGETEQVKYSLKEQVAAQEVKDKEDIAGFRRDAAQEIVKLRENFEVSLDNLRGEYEKRLAQVVEDLELHRKMEIHEIEERKNQHINDLMTNHQQAFTEMRNYYNSITQDNLSLIRDLNRSIAEMKKNRARIRSEQRAKESENASLSQPLGEVKAEEAELQDKLRNFAKDRASFRHTRARLRVLEQQYSELRNSHSHLVTKYKETLAARDQLYVQFAGIVGSVQRRSEKDNVVLESILAEYDKMFEQKKRQFTAILASSNLDPVAVQNVTKKLDDVISAKNETVADLQYEVLKTARAHDDLVKVMDAKLKKLGVPEQELGKRPLISKQNHDSQQLIAGAE